MLIFRALVNLLVNYMTCVMHRVIYNSVYIYRSSVDIVYNYINKGIISFYSLVVQVLTTDEYWPNCQKLNHPNDVNLLNLIMQSNGKDNSCKKTEKCESD